MPVRATRGPDASLGEPLLGCCGALQLLGAKLEPASHEQYLGGILRRQRRRVLVGGSVYGLDRVVDFPPFTFGCRVWELALKASPSDEIEAAIAGESGHAVENVRLSMRPRNAARCC